MAATSTSNAAATKLDQFDYANVRLLEGPMLDQFNANHAFFLAMNEDSLLKPFRQKAGLPAPGEDMGGWYSWSKDFDPPRNMTGYVPGHSFGQYLSGLARAYAATQDGPTRAKVLRLVRGFAPTVTPKFYVDYPLPCYTFDKTNCGLIDAYQFASDPIALSVLGHATDAVMQYLPPKALNRAEMQARPHRAQAGRRNRSVGGGRRPYFWPRGRSADGTDLRGKSPRASNEDCFRYPNGPGGKRRAPG